MALLAYDPTRMTTVPIEQARVIAYVVDTETGQQYSTVAQAQSAITAKRDEDSTRAGQPVATRPVPRGAVQRGEYEEPKPNIVVNQGPITTATTTATTTTTTTPTVTSTTTTNVTTSNVSVNPRKITGYKLWTNPSNGATYNVPVYDDGTDALTDWTGGPQVPQSFMLYTPPSSGGGGGNSSSQTSNQKDNSSDLQKYLEQQKADATAAAEAAKRQQAENAMLAVSARFKRYGLDSLVGKIKDLAVSGANESTITLQLQETPEYKQRFRANEDRAKKGLSVLEPGDYINLEDKYRQILRAYGLRQFDNDNYVTQFISNDVSTAELTSRVQMAVQRVQNADPAVYNTLTRYYGIGTNDLVAYALDPDTQFQKIERQIAAAEIGAAARLQGFEPGVAVAEQLASQGITQAEARKGYSTIADILPTAEKLSQIYGKGLESYGLAEAEQEVFNELASAQRKRRKLAEREISSFSGSSGVGRTSLSSQVGGQI